MKTLFLVKAVSHSCYASDSFYRIVSANDYNHAERMFLKNYPNARIQEVSEVLEDDGDDS